MNRMMTGLALALGLMVGAQEAGAQVAAAPGVGGGTAKVRVRYMVTDVPAVVAFYRDQLGFRVDALSGTYFAALSRGGVQLLISPTKGPGGASQPMPDGQRPGPGGWNRIVLDTTDLKGDVARLKQAGVRFRNEIVAGPGGREILLEDPSGNPVELFQPG
jgi:catechol 2,3-dioxygenase-like lactoylglutathione lyase family enzyme